MKKRPREVRNEAAKALVELQAKEAIPELIKILKDEDKDRNFGVISEAISALGQLQAKEAIPELIKILKDEDKDRNFGVISEAISALGQLQAKETIPELIATIPELIALLKDDDTRVSLSAAENLGKYDLNIIANGLFLGLIHNDVFVRKKSISVIGYYSKNENIQNKLNEIATNDPNEEIKDLAKIELEKLQYKIQILS